MKLLPLIIFVIAVGAISFVIRTIVLGQEFDIITELIQFSAVIVSVIGAAWITKKITHEGSPISVKTPLTKTV